MKIKIILIVLSIIVIISIIGIIMYINTPKGKMLYTLNYINGSSYDKDTIATGNIHELLSKYTGTIDSRVIDKSLYYFASELVPTFYTINDINSYFENNKEYIEKMTGINNYPDFEILVTKIKKLNGNFKIENIQLELNSGEKSSKGALAVASIQYEGNDKILFLVLLKDKLSEDTSPIEFTGTIRKEYLYDTTRETIEYDSGYQGTGIEI